MSGGLLPPKSYVDVPARRRKSDFLYTNFLPNFPPISIPFLQKHPILTKLGAYYNDLPKIHLIYVIWAPSSLMNPPIAIPNFAKKRPKRQAHIRIPCQCKNPPPPPGYVYLPRPISPTSCKRGDFGAAQTNISADNPTSKYKNRTLKDSIIKSESLDIS